jgi:acetyl esterase
MQTASKLNRIPDPLALQTFAGLSPEACRTLDAIGAVWNDDINKHRAMVMQIYAPIVARASSAGIGVVRDRAYGRHERHRLDVFHPDVQAGGARPVVVFVHGGAFVRGNKNMDDQFYGNVLRWFVRHGFVGINVEYRLAPESSFPGGAEDVAGAVAWVCANIAQYGGDPEQIILIGHSAGGTHAASYLLDPNIGITPAAGIKGLILVSARLRADAEPNNPNAKNVIAYFGAETALFPERSPVTYADRCLRPVFTVIAQNENRLLDIYGAEFYFRVAAARGRAPRFLRLARHNHTSIIAHFDSGEEILGRAILDFIVDECGIALPA